MTVSSATTGRAFACSIRAGVRLIFDRRLSIVKAPVVTLLLQPRRLPVTTLRYYPVVQMIVGQSTDRAAFLSALAAWLSLDSDSIAVLAYLCLQHAINPQS